VVQKVLIFANFCSKRTNFCKLLPIFAHFFYFSWENLRIWFENLCFVSNFSPLAALFFIIFSLTNYQKYSILHFSLPIMNKIVGRSVPFLGSLVLLC